MQEKNISSSLRLLFAIIIVGGFVCVAATTAQAQKQDGPRQISLGERENSARDKEAETTRRSPQGILAEVNEDLSRLNELKAGISTHAAKTNEILNYNSIIENVSEIKKRSTRLKTNLALPEAAKEKDADFKDVEKGELQPGLAALHKRLDSFLSNPIFGQAGAIDTQLAARAKGDLEDIIFLSEKLRKNAEKRSKSGRGKAQ